jgi:hypothetical protein
MRRILLNPAFGIESALHLANRSFCQPLVDRALGISQSTADGLT